MGQAFDRDGNVLGEASGETKREVFEALSRNHPEAEAILVRTLREKMEAHSQGSESEIGRPVDRMEQFFVYAHLPPHLQEISKPFGELATHIVTTLPSNAERTVALRKLLEAKDCAVRALIYK